MLSKSTFNISGMHCSSCALNIDFELEDIEGIIEAKTNYAKQNLEVTFDSQKIDAKKIITAVKKLGYQAELKN